MSFRLGERWVDLDAAVVRAESSYPLTPIEVKLLRYLADNVGRIVPREQLLVAVWGYRPGVRSRTVDNIVRRLREKIEADPSNPEHLLVVYGQGLLLVGLTDGDGIPPKPAGRQGRATLIDVSPPVSWTPPGWEAPDRSAAVWLDEAHHDAIRRQDGYVGVDHLVRALAAVDGGGPVTAALRRLAPRILRDYEHSSALIPQFPEDGAPRATPVLSGWGPSLGSGFEVDRLASLVLALAEPSQEDLPGNVTLPDAEPRREGPATGLVVRGGPEDGRRLALGPGATLGRAGGNADVVLYVDTRLTDRRLSRLHIRWEGAGRVTFERDGLARDVAIGDVLVLTSATYLLAV